MNSRRLPGKVLMLLGDETMLARAVRIATEAFGHANVVVAYPDTVDNQPIQDECKKVNALWFAYSGDENDVLGRFHAVSHAYRWHPGSIIVRHTPEDFRKSPEMMRRVANGERLPVEMGGEAFTLGMLDHANEAFQTTPGDDAAARAYFRDAREHITYALFPTTPPLCPEGIWTIDEHYQYLAAVEWLERQQVLAEHAALSQLIQPEYYAADEPPGREIL